MALSSRSQLYPRTASFCTGLAQRQGCCRCWIDALLQQWASRGPDPQAQIGQAIDVWPCQTSSVTATLAPCGLIGTEPFTRSLSSSVCASCFSFASPLAHSSKYADYPLFFVVRSKQARLIWGWAVNIIVHHTHSLQSLTRVSLLVLLSECY